MLINRWFSINNVLNAQNVIKIYLDHLPALTVGNTIPTVFLKNQRALAQNARKKYTRLSNTLRIHKIRLFIMPNALKYYRKEYKIRYPCASNAKSNCKASMLSTKMSLIIENVRRRCWVKIDYVYHLSFIV